MMIAVRTTMVLLLLGLTGAQAQPAAPVSSVVGVGSWGSMKFFNAYPGVLVRPGEVYAFVWWTGPRPDTTGVKVHFLAASGKEYEAPPDWTRAGQIACVVPVATARRESETETWAIARITLDVSAPQGVMPLLISDLLPGRPLLVDPTGASVLSTRGETGRLIGLQPPTVVIVRWPEAQAKLANRFVVLDQDQRLAGFGIQVSGDTGTGATGGIFAVPRHSCLPR